MPQIQPVLNLLGRVGNLLPTRLFVPHPLGGTLKHRLGMVLFKKSYINEILLFSPVPQFDNSKTDTPLQFHVSMDLYNN